MAAAKVAKAARAGSRKGAKRSARPRVGARLTGEILAAAIQCVVDPRMADLRRELDEDIHRINSAIGLLDQTLGRVKAEFEALKNFYQQRDATREFRRGLRSANPGIFRG